MIDKTNQNQFRYALLAELSDLRLQVRELRTAKEELSRAQEARRNSEEHYRLLVENTGEAILVIQNGLVKFFNQKATEIIGYTAERFTDQSFLEFVHPEDRDRLRDIHARRLQGLPAPSFYLARVHAENGELLWLELNGVRIVWEGRPAVLVFCNDVTEKKRAEDELYRSETQLNSIMKSTPDIIYRLDPEGRITFISPAVERYGYTAAELIGHGLLELVHPDDRETAWKRINDRRTGDRHTKNMVIRLLKKDRTSAPFEAEPRELSRENIFVIESGGLYDTDQQGERTFLGTQGIARDITERRLLEEQLRQSQKMEAVGTLSGGIAHDFNNLLHAVQGYTEMLLEGKTRTDKGYHELKQIERAVHAGTELTRQLTTFSRRLESNLRPVNLNKVVKRTMDMVSRAIPKMVDIELNLAENLDSVLADTTQMEQVLLNLAVNARDAMSEGGRLTVETAGLILDERDNQAHPGLEPGEYLLLTVADNGHGMDRQTASRIFDPFFTTKDTGKGTGLGLSMVYGIIQNHRGHIRCHSRQGQGTVFHIYLPARSGIVLDEPGLLAETMTPDLRGGSETILLVDDEPAVLELTQTFLEEYGFKTIAASSGEKALAIYKESGADIDLVVLDLGMPGLGGFNCLKELLGINPQIRVIISSGYSGQVRTSEALKAGALAFVGKPYRMADMLIKVRDVLDRHGT